MPWRRRCAESDPAHREASDQPCELGDQRRPCPHHGHLTLVSRDPRDLQQFTDSLWARLRREAEDAYDKAPMLAPLFLDSIIKLQDVTLSK